MHRILKLLLGLAVATPVFCQAINTEDDSTNDHGITTTEGFYVGALVGGHWGPDTIGHETDDPAIIGQFDIDPGYDLGLSLGYRFCSGWRLEAEFAYTHSDIEGVSIFDSPTNNHDETASEWGTWNFMFNVLYECVYCACDCVVFPYFGFGLGTSHVNMHTHDAALTFVVDDDDWVFAYQLIMGVAYPINSCMDMGLEYRFVNVDRVALERAGVIYRSLEWTGSHHLLVTAKYVIGRWCP